MQPSAKAVPSIVRSSKGRAYRRYVVLMLMLVFAVQYLNRQVPVLLAQSIKAEFALSDAQLGLLTGFVFSIPYVLMMFPVGFLVDRGNRRNILLVGLTVWSGLTTLTGLVRSLTELMLIRVCIAAAEGVNNPTSLSIISDLYDRKSRATAVGFLFAGPAIGSIIGFPLVAFIADRYGWRVGYFAAGLPGIILAVVFYLTIREPQREESAPGKEGAAPPLGETLRFLWTQRSSLHLMAGMMLTTIITSGNIAWMMPLLMRGHAISLSQASLIVSLAWGVANAIGQMSGGTLADWLARRDIRWHAWLPASSALGGGLLMIGSSLVPNTGSAVVLLGLWSLSAGFQYGPVLGTLQGLVRPRMRGVASSCMTLLINLVGAGGGPLLVGVLSDHFSGWHGITSIQWALATVALLQVWPLVHFLRAAHFLRGNIARIEQNAASSESPA